jgi:hypothetical protein
VLGARLAAADPAAPPDPTVVTHLAAALVGLPAPAAAKRPLMRAVHAWAVGADPAEAEAEDEASGEPPRLVAARSVPLPGASMGAALSSLGSLSSLSSLDASPGEAPAGGPSAEQPQPLAGREPSEGDALPQPAAADPQRALRSLGRFSPKQLCTLAWACGRLGHDSLELLEASAELLLARAHAPGARPGLRLGGADVVRLLGGWAKFNRRPSDELMELAARQYEAATAGWPQADEAAPAAPAADGGADAGGGASAGECHVRELSTLLYSLALMREHTGPLAALAARQLAAVPGLAASPALSRQGPQLAAVLLAARAEAVRAGAPGGGLAGAPGPGGGAPSEDHAPACPLEALLPAEAREAALESWRATVARRAAAATRGRQQKDLCSAARALGLPARAGVPTSDGAAAADVLVKLSMSASPPAAPAAVGPPQPQGQQPLGQGQGAQPQPQAALADGTVRLALELIGPHNTAANGTRITGEAALKYRLLQVRGRPVVGWTGGQGGVVWVARQRWVRVAPLRARGLGALPGGRCR